MTRIEATGYGWFRKLGPLFVRGTTSIYEGRTETDYSIGVNIGAQTFELAWVVIRYSEDNA